MYDFIAAYFLFLPFYPVVIVGTIFQPTVESVIWLLISLGGIFLTYKYNYKLLKKIFISIWLMPGTIVCGSAAIIPWPLTISALFYQGGCSNLLWLSVTLLFNVLIVFGSFMLVEKIRKKRASA